MNEEFEWKAMTQEKSAHIHDALHVRWGMTCVFALIVRMTYSRAMKGPEVLRAICVYFGKCMVSTWLMQIIVCHIPIYLWQRLSFCAILQCRCRCGFAFVETIAKKSSESKAAWPRQAMACKVVICMFKRPSLVMTSAACPSFPLLLYKIPHARQS